jgi:hypothetical protein
MRRLLALFDHRGYAGWCIPIAMLGRKVLQEEAL